MRILLTLLMVTFVIMSGIAGLLGPDYPVFYKVMAAACISFAGIAIIRQLLFLTLAGINYRNNIFINNQAGSDDFLPKISIIVPAYNEEAVIAKALQSLQNIDYPNYNILVIDDGSSDDTFLIASMVAQSSHIPIQVISQQNGGKSKALNNGLRISDAPFVLCVDADSQMKPSGLRSAIHRFNDPKVVAVAGHVEVNPQQISPLATFQRLEYQLMQRVGRNALSLLKCIPIVPGPAGLFRKESVIQIGGYDAGDKCFAEDAELSMSLLSSGGRIVSDKNLVAITQAPISLDALLRQRYRWFRGSLQAIFNNFDKLMGRGSMRSFFLFVYLVLEYIMMPIAGLSIGLFFLFDTLSAGTLTPLMWGLFILIALEFVGLVTVCQSLSEFPTKALTFIALKLSLGYLLLFWSFFCLIDEINDQSMSWDKLERYDL